MNSSTNTALLERDELLDRDETLLTQKQSELLEIENTFDFDNTDAREITTETSPDSDVTLDQDITTPWLLKFAAPTILSTVIMSAFGMIDGVFAARLIAPEALAAVGIVWPFLAFVMAVAFMLSIGGSALVGKLIGEGKQAEGRSVFTMLTLVTIGASVVLSVFGALFPETLLNILGVNEFLRPLALTYLTPLVFILPAVMLGFFIQQYFITDGKPSFGLYATIVGGLINLGLNFLLIARWQWGLRGAAISTSIGYAVPAVFGLVYFLRNRKGPLYFSRPSWDLRALGKSCVNGASEMVTMLAMSITAIAMNNILIRLVGHEGVTAATIVGVGQGLLMSLFLGYSSGIAPVISFNYGKQDRNRLKRLFHRSIAIIAASSAIAMLIGFIGVNRLVSIYLPAGTDGYQLTVYAFRIGLLSFLFMGFNMFASILFTALNNGKLSGVLSFFRTLVFILAMLSLLPAMLGLTGVWLALPAAELLGLAMATWFVIRKSKHYGYA